MKDANGRADKNPFPSLFAVAQGLFGALALGDVHRRALNTGDLTIGVAHRNGVEEQTDIIPRLGNMGP